MYIYIYVHATRKFHHISIISTIFSSESQIYMTQKGVCHAENPLYHHYITLYAIIFVPLHHIVGMYTMGVWERHIPMISPLYHHYCAITLHMVGIVWVMGGTSWWEWHWCEFMAPWRYATTKKSPELSHDGSFPQADHHPEKNVNIS